VDEPQRFHYATRIGFGVSIAGVGEAIAERDLPDGGRVSALRFRSEHPLSLIDAGSGYWRYLPTPEGVRFLTVYDYRTRFGLPGAWVDRLLFRPLMGWATAWSFDRLRLWLEDGISPARSFWLAAVHAVAGSGSAGLLGGTAISWLATGPRSRQAAAPHLMALICATGLALVERRTRDRAPSAGRCLRRPGVAR
jgi:hypothetical protein